MTARTFAVVTDSTADFPPGWREEYVDQVVPLRVLFGSESFRDGVDLTSADFFHRLEAASQLPTSSAPSPGDFAAVYEALRDRFEGVISIHLGSNLSATAESARLGASAVEGFRVHVVDSLSTSICLSFLCKVAAQSPSLDEAIMKVEAAVPRTRLLALLDTMKYVQMGGRVSRVQYLLGSMLDVKPILLVSEGAVNALDKVRTRSKGIPRMAEHFRAMLPVAEVGVVHGQAASEAEQLAQLLSAELGRDVPVAELGSVLGVHVGPRAIGIAVLGS